MDINTLSTKLEIKYYKSIIDNLSKNNINYIWLNKHLDKLNDHLDKKEIITETCTEKNIITESNHNQIFNDDDLYKKSWSKLNSIHKILKIKEFVNNLKINSEEERTNLKDELTSLIKSKVLTNKDKIKYDEVNGKIISLVNLQYKNGKYFYQNN
jgi:hypothetical protein